MGVCWRWDFLHSSWCINMGWDSIVEAPIRYEAKVNPVMYDISSDETTFVEIDARAKEKSFF